MGCATTKNCRAQHKLCNKKDICGESGAEKTKKNTGACENFKKKYCAKKNTCEIKMYKTCAKHKLVRTHVQDKTCVQEKQLRRTMCKKRKNKKKKKWCGQNNK